MKKNYILLLLALFFAWSSNAQITLTQSVDPVNVTVGGVACWDNTGLVYFDNSFFRAYDLSDFGVTEDFEVSSVEFGQGSADDGKELVLNIYTADSDILATATLTLIATTTHTASAANDLTLVSVPISASIPAGSIIAFEIFAADSNGNQNETYFPGLNPAGENDSSYIMAPNVCNITVPTATGAIGFPDNQYVMNVVGDLLSVDEFSLDLISVSPNPTTDFININLPSAINDFETKIYSITGKLVFTSSNTTQLDISKFNSGVYLLKVSSDDFGEVTRRIIKN